MVRAVNRIRNSSIAILMEPTPKGDFGMMSGSYRESKITVTVKSRRKVFNFPIMLG